MDDDVSRETRPIIAAEYVKFTPVPSRSVIKLEFEVPYEQGDASLHILGFPANPGAGSKWVGIVPLAKAPEALEREEGRREYPLRAAMLCTDGLFQAYAAEITNSVLPLDEEACAEFIRKKCQVKSRADLSTSERGQKILDKLESAYDAWRYNL